jgi:hypothetical protein
MPHFQSEKHPGRRRRTGDQSGTAHFSAARITPLLKIRTKKYAGAVPAYFLRRPGCGALRLLFFTAYFFLAASIFAAGFLAADFFGAAFF